MEAKAFGETPARSAIGARVGPLARLQSRSRVDVRPSLASPPRGRCPARRGASVPPRTSDSQTRPAAARSAAGCLCSRCAESPLARTRPPPHSLSQGNNGHLQEFTIAFYKVSCHFVYPLASSRLRESRHKPSSCCDVLFSLQISATTASWPRPSNGRRARASRYY